jgi:gluconolactonase
MMLRKYAPWMISMATFTSAFSAHQVSLPTTLAEPGTQVVDVKIGLSYSEGPAVDPQGNLFFSEDPDINAGRIWKITPDGKESAYKDPSRGSNGLEFDNQGRLHIAMLDSLLRVELDGKVTVLAAGTVGGRSLSRVNDLSVSSTGAVFFTNLGGGTVFFRSPDGAIKTRVQGSVNGVEWVEETNTIYLAQNGLQKCTVNNTTGDITGCSTFAGGTDGLTLDALGNVWRADWSAGRVFAHSPTGQQLGFIAIDAKEVQGKRFSGGVGGNTSNCHFGGPDLKTLFITGDGGLYKVQLKVAGRRRPNWPTVGVGQSLKKPLVQTMAKRLWAGNGLLILDTRYGKASATGRLQP